jgi:hypothetical protein
VEFWTIFILAIILVGLAAIGFAIGILVKKDGKFPEIHVSGNRYLREKGITCIQDFDRKEQKQAREKDSYKKLRLFRRT